MPSSPITNPSTLRSRARREKLRQAKLASRLASGFSAPPVIPLPVAASTLRVRKHREKLKAARVLRENSNNPVSNVEATDHRSTTSDPEVNPPDADETTAIVAARNAWPRRLAQRNIPSSIRLHILKSALKAIIKLVKPRGSKPKISGLHYDWHYRVYLFLKLQVKQEEKALEGPDLFTGRVHVLEFRKGLAKRVADGGGWGKRIRDRILRQEVSWVKKRYIEKPKQGQHQKILFMLDDAETMLMVHNYINSVGERLISFGLARAVTEYWRTHDDDIRNRSINNVARQVEKVISSSTASRWLHKLGFKWKEYRKAVYNDGHERSDIKRYRQEVFLPLLESYTDRLMAWDESLHELPNRDLDSGEMQPLIFVTQDECTFNSNDGVHYLWVHDEHKPLRKKGRGKGLHVSDFVTPIGRLGDGNTCVIMPCGGDTWWTGDKLLAQVVDKAIPDFEAQFPGCQALFAFDNSRNHLKYADNALRVSEMNLEPGGLNKKVMRNTFVIDPRQANGGYIQSMILPSGIPKGLRLVLIERGLWPSDRPNFRAQCSVPTKTGKGTKPNPLCLQGGTCCARALLASQPDFQAQKSQLQEAIEQAGHLVIFYPAFHCEINFIEYYWGAGKQYTRRNCGYDFDSLQRLVPEALKSVPPQLIWKYHARTVRIMEAYRHNIVYASPEYEHMVHTRYRSHRRVTIAESTSA